MGLKEINHKLRVLEGKKKFKKKNWKGNPKPIISEERAIRLLKLIHEINGVEGLIDLFGEDKGIKYYNLYLCTDDSYTKQWYN